MLRLKQLLLYAASLAPALATQPNIGWRAEIVANHVTFDTNTANGQDQLYVYAPVNLTRVSSSAESITLSIYAAPYAFNSSNPDSQNADPTLVGSATVQPPAEAYQSTIEAVSFDVSAETWKKLGVCAFAVGVQGQSGEDGTSRRLSTEWNGAVVVYNATGGSWKAWNEGKYAHAANMETRRKYKDRKYDGTEEGEVKKAREPEKGYTRVDKVVAKGGPTGTESREYTYSGYSEVSYTEGAYTQPSYTESYIDHSATQSYASVTTQPDSHPSYYCSCNPYTVWSTITIYPNDPAPSNPSSNHSSKRYDPSNPALVDATITFKDRNNEDQPLRYTRLTAVADYYQGDVKLGEYQSITWTDGDGIALFSWHVSPGQRIVAHTLIADLVGEHYVVGTRDTEWDEITPAEVVLDMTLNPWLTEQGHTSSIGTQFPLSKANEALWVADAYSIISTWFSVNVASNVGEMQKIRVWYPATKEGAFFGSGGGLKPYINLPAMHAANPVVMAHEYGHFAHYMARRNASFNGGGDHWICGQERDVKIQTSLSEGYATALGLLAIDQTPLASREGYMVYESRQVGYYPFVASFEDFNCTERPMTNQEGRIAAAFLDLVDRKLDDFHAATDDFGYIGVGFSSVAMNYMFQPRFVFWRSMYDNPATILEWW